MPAPSMPVTAVGWRRLGTLGGATASAISGAISRSFWTAAAVSAALLVGGHALARDQPSSSTKERWGETVALTALPTEAQSTYRLVLSGGPFPYEKDGTVFGNRERQLPAKARGYYREYTVQTPGLRHRGARRVVCGGKPPTKPDACYYTDDHYASFSKIAP